MLPWWRAGRSVVAMTVIASVALFVVAAVAEIGGAYLVWEGIRERHGWPFVVAGVPALGRVRVRRDVPAVPARRSDPGRLRRRVRRWALAWGWRSIGGRTAST